MTTERIDVQDDGRRCHCCGETLDRCRETYRGSTAPATAIDALAVMDAIGGWAREVSDQFIDSEEGMRAEYVQDLRNYREARAAVAELIEISNAIAAHNRGNDRFTPHRVPSVKWERWRAALARVGGAS